ncbi:hypothetical protein [Candidatus Nitronereus thalassa]|uniref:Transmembrane protein n=1 Tax=Candidatus Nitronereus thalassa TaxID=3020898 RepID=A0ABU3KBR8_9BACT|nr:hypothetical protein [Candidatus Nitronereus thalassa]MDT7043617.1 hypothetical protein [Candidatus Nitronereus thalassa]
MDNEIKPEIQKRNLPIEKVNEETLQKYHDQIFQMVNARLTETFKFYTPLVAALTGFGWIWVQTIESKDKATQFADLTTISFYLSMAILLSSVIYLLNVSYTYRALQIVLAGLERILGLYKFSPGWDPCHKIDFEGFSKTFWKRLIPFWIMPEILKSHLYMFALAALVITFTHIKYFRGSICYSLCLWLFILVIIYMLNGHLLFKLRRQCESRKKSFEGNQLVLCSPYGEKTISHSNES